METASKIASNTFSQVAARFFNAAISIVIIRIITGYLAADGYGRYTIIYSFIAFFDIAADLGLFTIAVSEMSKAPERMEKILGNIMSLRLVIVTILTILACVSVFFFPQYSQEMKIGIMIAAVTMAFNHIGITLSSSLQVHYKMPLNAVAIAVSKVATLGMTWYVATAKLGFTMLIVTGLINNVLIVILIYFFGRRYMRIHLAADTTEWKRLIGKTLIYGLSLICGAFFIYFSPLVLSAFYSESEVGVYGVASKVVQLLVIIPFAFMNSVLPSMGKHIKDTARLHDIVQNSFDFLIVLGLGMLAGTVVLSGPLINLASGGGAFASAAEVLGILSFGVFFLFLHNLFSYVLLATDKQKTLLKINIVAALVTIGANFLLIPLHGAFGGSTGAAIASSAPQLIILLGTYFVARRTIGLKLSFKNAFKVLLSAIVMGAVLIGLNASAFSHLHPITQLFVDTAIGMIVYFSVLIVIKGISPQARDVLIRQIPFIGSKIARAPQSKLIAMDIRAISAEKTGKEWYTLNVLEALSEIDHTNHYILYTRYRYDSSWLPENFSVKRIRLPLPLWHLYVLFDLWARKADILFAPASYIAPSLVRWKRIKIVLVIHDAVAFLFPQKHQLKARLVEKYTVGLALKHAKTIIAVSDHTKRDIVRLFNLQPEDVRVIGEAARKTFMIREPLVIKNVLYKYHLPDKYILFVGTIEPRKNLVTLLKAYEKLPERDQYKLVLVGKRGWYHSEIFKAAKSRDLSPNIIFTGYVPDEDLPAILQGATVFVMPSLYEGFGLPLLEAFSCGTAVVSSNSSALREIANGTCLMFDPLNQGELAEALHRVLTDEDLRSELIDAGLKRSQEYSWEKTARQIIACFNEIGDEQEIIDASAGPVLPATPGNIVDL